MHEHTSVRPARPKTSACSSTIVLANLTIFWSFASISSASFTSAAFHFLGASSAAAIAATAARAAAAAALAALAPMTASCGGGVLARRSSSSFLSPCVSLPSRSSMAFRYFACSSR